MSCRPNFLNTFFAHLILKMCTIEIDGLLKMLKQPQIYIVGKCPHCILTKKWPKHAKTCPPPPPQQDSNPGPACAEQIAYYHTISPLSSKIWLGPSCSKWFIYFYLTFRCKFEYLNLQSHQNWISTFTVHDKQRNFLSLGISNYCC